MALVKRAEDLWSEEPITTVSTDNDGQFLIPWKQGVKGPFAILVTAPEYCPWSHTIVIPETELPVTLQWSASLHGRVIDADTSAPIANAIVDVHGKRVSSERDGTYRLADLPAGNRLTLIAYAPEHGNSESFLTLPRAGNVERDIPLQHGEPLWVQVVDLQTGAPLTGFEVGDRGRPALETTIQAGRFLVHAFRGQETSVTVAAEDYCSFYWTFEGDDVLGVNALRIPMARFAWIDGRVTDSSGTPVEGSTAYAICEKGHFGSERLAAETMFQFELPGRASYSLWQRSKESDRDGRFSTPVIPAECPYFLQVSHEDFLTHREGPVVARYPGERANVDVVLEQGGTILGRVLRNGTAWRCSVRLQKHNGEVGGTKRTDENGDFRFDNVSPGSVKVSLGKSRFTGLPETTLQVEAGGVHRHDFEWNEELATISGRLMTESGEPLPGLHVRISGLPSQQNSFPAVADKEGRFVLEVRQGRVYDVYAHRNEIRRSIDGVQPGATNVDLVFPEMGRLALDVVDADTGKQIGISSRGVSWRSKPGESFQEVMTGMNERGFAEVTLPLGMVDLQIAAQHLGYRPAIVRDVLVSREKSEILVVEIRKGLDLQLRILGELPFGPEQNRGHLLFLLEESQLGLVEGPFPGSGGRANASFWGGNGLHMWIGDPTLHGRILRPDEGGVAQLRGLEPGTYFVRAFPDDFIFAPETFEVTPDSDMTREVRWRAR